MSKIAKKSLLFSPKGIRAFDLVGQNFVVSAPFSTFGLIYSEVSEGQCEEEET